MNLKELLIEGRSQEASDFHLTVGLPPVVRSNGELKQLKINSLSQKDIESYVKEILDENDYEKYLKNGEIDISYSVNGVGRYRANVYKQRGSNAIALRAVGLNVPTLSQLEMPNIVTELTNLKSGLVLVTGPTGSGKSTTLAAMIDEINSNDPKHIVTLEDPIEYIHKHKKSMVNQREIGKDTLSYNTALRAALREDPDVILIGEMRDFETISTAITAAETGHLVFSTLHTVGGAKTIDRIIDVFPEHQQQQIRVQLAGVLKGVVSQQLLPSISGKKRVAALETMISTPAVENLIREGKTHQIHSCIQTGSKYGMKTMDSSIAELFKQGLITRDTALNYSVEKELLERLITL